MLHRWHVRLWPHLHRLWAHLGTHKDHYGSIQAIITILGIVCGGIWTYALTAQFRETKPKMTIKQDLAAWKLQSGDTLLRVDSVLTNASKVQIKSIEGKMIVIRLLPETKAQLDEYTKGNFWFVCSKPDCIPEQGLNVPASSRSEFRLSDPSPMEPGENSPFWRYVHLAGDVSAVEVYTSIKRSDGTENDWIFDNSFNVTRH